jgi:enamine deaminase RidA (YjgF/YER057c/UK114 family)
MQYQTIDCGKVPAAVNVSCFTGQSGVREIHLCVRPTEYAGDDVQLKWVDEAYRQALSALGIGEGTAVFRRFYCSDLPNQVAALESRPFSNPRAKEDPCAVSWVCQPPMPPVKVALWAYHVVDPNEALDKTLDGASLVLDRNGLRHLWTTGIVSPSGENSYDQTRGVFTEYEGWLGARNLSLANHVIRTWLFVQNVDVNYHGLVAARRELFVAHGLTPDTHFIASTGVEGASADPNALVTMDAYAIAGVEPRQIAYLADLDHLSPTHVYGVTFERGTSVAYRDRKHVFISGTASIDRNGEILHAGDVSRQLDRTLANVEALLAQAGATSLKATANCRRSDR